MRVYLCSDYLNQIKQSGVGRAIEHQQMALDEAQIPYTLTGDEPYELLHINTVFLKSYLRAKKAKREGKKVAEKKTKGQKKRDGVIYRDQF